MKIRELFEEAGADNLKLELSAAVNQIASRVKDTGANQPVNINAILDVLSDLGINLSEKQLRTMYTQPPLSNIIASIQGDDVIFIGQRVETNDTIKPDQTTPTLEKMAKRAADKRS